MNWDPTIRLGDILTSSAFVGVGVGAYFRLRERLIAIETKLEPLWEEFAERRSGHERRTYKWPRPQDNGE